MPDDLPASILRVRTGASRLNQITEQASQTVRAVEQFLNEECSVGVPARVTVGSEFDEEFGVAVTETYLAYRRVGQRFRIAVVDLDVDPRSGPPQRETVKPWSDCGRDVKLETFKKLPDLMAEIARNLENWTSDAEQSIPSVCAMVSALTQRAEG